MSGWYYLNEERICGPLTTERLSEHAADGTIGPDTLMWSDDEPTPRDAMTIPEIAFFFSEEALRESDSAREASALPLRACLVAWSTIAVTALAMMALFVWSAMWLSNDDLGSYAAGRGLLILVIFAGGTLWIRAAHHVLKGQTTAIRQLWRSQTISGCVALIAALIISGAAGLIATTGLMLLLLGGAAFASEGQLRHWQLTQRVISS